MTQAQLQPLRWMPPPLPHLGPDVATLLTLLVHAQVAGSDWKMSILGEAAPEEPRFSTWEDVKAKRKASGQSAQVRPEDLSRPDG